MGRKNGTFRMRKPRPSSGVELARPRSWFRSASGEVTHGLETSDIARHLPHVLEDLG